jgi:hypothetical protein
LGSRHRTGAISRNSILDMSPDQIADEQRRGRVAAVAAVLSAALFIASTLWSQVLSSDAPTGNSPASLRYLDRHSGDLLGSSTLRGIALLLLLPVTYHLFRAIKDRRPEEPQVVLVMGVYGPIAAGIGTILVAAALTIGANDFAHREFQTINAADDVIRTAQLIGLLSISGFLALGFWFVKGPLDAMRIGLLSRLMGMVGIAIGPGLVLPFLATIFQFVVALWLVAAAALFSGIGMRHRPPAWESGEAVPLPTARERLGGALDDGLRTAPNGEVEAVGPGVRKRDPSEPVAAPRRKRKRRR